jgi:hypothetical protein
MVEKMPLPCTFDVSGPDPYGESEMQCNHSRWVVGIGDFCDPASYADMIGDTPILAEHGTECRATCM